MRPVRLYSTTYCGFCHRAKKLLQERGIDFEEIDVTHDDDSRAWLRERTQRWTVPQIFIGEEPIGGYDELRALDRSGELQRMLSAA